MGAHSPEELQQLWTRRFRARDVDGLLELYERDAIVVPRPGFVISRREDLRQPLEEFVATNAAFEHLSTDVLAQEELALVYSRWRLAGGSGPDGTPLDMSGMATEVVRRQPDGSWLFAIDDPYGVAPSVAGA